MGDPSQADETPMRTDGVAKRDPPIPASEEGTGIVPGDEGDRGRDTHLPASEEDTDSAEDSDDSPSQSWPGDGGPGTIPPPG